MSMAGCELWAVDEKSLLGRYEGALPDGGMEAIELKAGGVCDQKIILVSGKIYSSSGTWKYTRSEKVVEIRGTYISVDFDGSVNGDIGKNKDTLRLLGVRKGLFGGIAIGHSEGMSYEKR
jgi:hypothetical protein